MKNYNFADIYRSAHFSLEPAHMALRQKSADRFLQSLSFDDCLGLVRLYFGLAAPDFRDRIVEIFREDDGTFSIVGNERELTILCAGILASAINDENVIAALALVTTSFGGKRVASVVPELVEWAKTQLYQFAVTDRASSGTALTSNARLPKSKIAAHVDTWLQAPDFPKLAPLLKQLALDADASAAIANKNAENAANNLAREMQLLREELEMLWWNVGGYSTQLNTPFADLPKELVPILSGIELASLTRSTVGPVAVGALIQLKLKSCDVSPELEITKAVDALAEKNVPLPQLPDSASFAELCPLIAAVELRRTIGDDTAWHNAFRKRAGIQATTKLPPLDLAMQIFREVLLLKARTEQ